MSDEQEWPTHCPTCGTRLASAVIDLDPSNEPRAELNPGEMVAQDYCPNPDCPTNRDRPGADLPGSLGGDNGGG